MANSHYLPRDIVINGRWPTVFAYPMILGWFIVMDCKAEMSHFFLQLRELIKLGSLTINTVIVYL